MPDGTVPSSTEALRAALSAAKSSLEAQLKAGHTDAADDALRQVHAALSLLPSDRLRAIEDAEWVEAAASPPSQDTNILGDPAAQSGTMRRDELTRIRGIDAALAKRLAALGIHRFEQVAAWEVDDVRVIADAMGLGRRFLAMGIVEQALELERQRRASVAKQPQPPKPLAPHAVAVWEPQGLSATTDALVRAPTTWKPLAGDDLRRAIATVRMRLPMNRIVPLAALVPELATPIYIATDYDSAVELPRWRTGVLVPFVQAPDALDRAPGLTRLQTSTARTPIVAAPVAAAMPPAQRTVVATAAQAPSTVAPSPRQPLPVDTTDRLAGLEAAIDALTTRDAMTPRINSAAVAASAPMDQRRPMTPRTAMPPPEARRAAARDQRPVDDVAEADVEIVTSRERVVSGHGVPGHKSSGLSPLPSLLLTPGVTRRGHDAIPATFGSAEVEEAAVVIVKRASSERNAADLAFYKAAPQPPVGPVRRFVRALAGA